MLLYHSAQAKEANFSSRGNIQKTSSEYFFSLLVFIMIPPFYLWQWKQIVTLAVITCGIISLCNMAINKNNVFSLFILFYLYIYTVIKDDRNIIGFFASILLCTLFISSGTFIKNVFKKFILIYSITLVPSILVHILVNFSGVQIPYTIIPPLNELKDYNYYCYPFLVQATNEISLLPRFCAYYDEPGVVGTISSILFACNGFSLRKIVNIPIFIAGIFSFSLAFYIVILFYGIVLLPVRYRILFIAIFVVLSTYLLSENEAINQYIFRRLEIKNGSLSGDNRTVRGFDAWYNNFRMTEDYYWGVGKKTSLMVNYGGASYKDLITSYGIVFFIFYCFSFLIIAFEKLGLKREFFIYLFLFASVIYQRPFIASYSYVFFLYASILYLSEKYPDKVRRTNKPIKIMKSAYKF